MNGTFAIFANKSTLGNIPDEELLQVEVCGFVSQSYLTKFCQMNFGTSPGEIRRNL